MRLVDPMLGIIVSGNPISYFNGNRWNFTWQNGRQLTSASTTVGNTDIDIAYTYDFDGLRTSKTVTYTTTEEEEHTHEYTETVVEATCTEDGYTIFTCSCGDSYLDDIVDALGHNYVESETETGTVFTCSRCGDSYTGHTHSYTETVTAPTCTEAGYTTYTCSCGDSYTGNNIAALGHNYVQSGETYTCTRCGDSYSGHQHTYTETVTEPTCEQDGYITYTCACGYSYTDNVVPALGHDYVLAGQDETIWTYACTRCGLSYTVVAPIVPEPPIEEYGLRRSRVSVVTEHHEYVYASGTLLRETITTTDEEGNVTTETLDFVYDLNGSPYALNYTNGTAATQTYYYITNVQGDVTHLVTADGEVVAEYGYDAWGKVTAATGTMADINPLGYRGYYYDAESGLYYLQSRCYDPVTCRFINADSYVSTGQDFLGYNMFAYCGNNPANNGDLEGTFFITICGTIIGGLVAAVTRSSEKESFWEAALRWATTGFIAGVALDIRIATANSKGLYFCMKFTVDIPDYTKESGVLLR